MVTRISHHLKLLIIFSMLMLLTACAGAKSPPVVPDHAAAGDLSMEECSVKIKKTSYAADCGMLVVPENRNDPDSRLIVLPVTRLRATGDTPAEPIFYLAGGPGGPNTFGHPEGLIEEHDIVIVGYRGAEGSVTLDCPEVTAALKRSDNWFNEAGLDSFENAFTQCADRLEAEGVDLAGYTPLEVVDDVEAARVALGYGKINLLGESYGTRLEQYYIWRYPENVKRAILIAVNPPGRAVWEPEKIDEQIEYYADLCTQDPACSARTGDLAETIRSVSEDMPDRWLFFRIKPGNVRASTFMLLYHTATAPQVFDAWLDAAEGDPGGLFMLSVAGDMIIPTSLIWGESAAKASSADYDPERDYRADMNPPDSIIGSPASLLLWGGAAGWPVTPLPEEYKTIQETDVEVLLVSGSIDFSTPKEYATDDLLPALHNGQQVILSEYGHTADFWSLQPEASLHLLTTYYATGEVDDSLYTYHPVDFKVGLGFGDMIKLALVGIVVIPLLIGGLVWYVVRRRRLRRANPV